MMRSTLVLFVVFSASFLLSNLMAQKGGKTALPPLPENITCLDCHKAVLKGKSLRIREKGVPKDLAALHLRHYDSDKTEYEGLQRKCITCHEAYIPVKPGEMKAGYFNKGNIWHPNAALEPKGYWRKLIQRPDTRGNPAFLEAIHPEDPYLFKPSLQKLICLKCHGPDSKIKTLFGTPEESGIMK